MSPSSNRRRPRRRLRPLLLAMLASGRTTAAALSLTGIRAGATRPARRATARRMATDSKSLQRRARYFNVLPEGDEEEDVVPATFGEDGLSPWTWKDALSLKTSADRILKSVTEAVGMEAPASAVTTTATTAKCTTYYASSVSSSSQSSLSLTSSLERRFSVSSPLSYSSRSYASTSSTPPTPQISLSEDERRLFELLLSVTSMRDVPTTLRVAGGWVRDKILATKDYHRATDEVDSRKTKHPSKGRRGSAIIGLSDPGSDPVDIDIALDDMLGREFADQLNRYLTEHGRDRISVGMVLKNPEKSKHLETATMKVGKFWIDFVNLRAEEYAGDSRIPDLMRIGSAEEDAYRRDLTINALFYNLNTGTIEDLTHKGLSDLQRGVVSTPLLPLTTLLDDPLRVLRSIRFAARLRFVLDPSLSRAASDPRVREALGQKVSRERIGGEFDLMLRSPDPVGAVRLLYNHNLLEVVFPDDEAKEGRCRKFAEGLALLSATHDYLCDCKSRPPVWCQSQDVNSISVNNGADITSGDSLLLAESTASPSSSEEPRDPLLMDDEDGRRLLWYAAVLCPLRKVDSTPTIQKKPRRRRSSMVTRLLVDDLKRPSREADSVERILAAADGFRWLISHEINSGGVPAWSEVILSGLRIRYVQDQAFVSEENNDGDAGRWERVMQFRCQAATIMEKAGRFWRAGLVLALSEELRMTFHSDDVDYAIEGDVVEQSHKEQHDRIVTQHEAFAVSMIRLGLVGISERKLPIDGNGLSNPDLLPNIPQGPVFRTVMDEQKKWIWTHPQKGRQDLILFLRGRFPEFC